MIFRNCFLMSRCRLTTRRRAVGPPTGAVSISPSAPGVRWPAKGADLFIIDDPHSEQDAVIGETNPEVYDRVMSWYEGGPRQRLQPGGAIIVVMTRWSLRDLTGQLAQKAAGRRAFRPVGDRPATGDPAFRQADLAGILVARRSCCGPRRRSRSPSGTPSTSRTRSRKRAL